MRERQFIPILQSVSHHRLHPFALARHTFHSHPHQFDATTRKFLFSLKKIARIRPKRSLFERNDKRSCASCKSTQPFASLPSVSHIFIVVRIGSRHDVKVKTMRFHRCAKCSNALSSRSKGRHRVEIIDERIGEKMTEGIKERTKQKSRE